MPPTCFKLWGVGVEGPRQGPNQGLREALREVVVENVGLERLMQP